MSFQIKEIILFLMIILCTIGLAVLSYMTKWDCCIRWSF